MAYDPFAVANHFLNLASAAESTLSAMKIQKLVYFAHGWNLAISGAPLINEAVQAWPYGPVIPSLYHEFKKYGSGPITSQATIIVNPGSSDLRFSAPTVGDEETKELLSSVWDTYGCFSAVQLSNLTHQPGSPWHTVHSENPNVTGLVIPDTLIKTYFESLITAA